MTTGRQWTSRRAVLSGTVLVLIVGLVASSVVADRPTSLGAAGSAGLPAVSVISDDQVPPAVLASRTFFSSADSVVVVAPTANRADRDKALETAIAGRVPVFDLAESPTPAVRDELARLSANAVIPFGSDTPNLGVDGRATEVSAPAVRSDRETGDAIVLVAGGPDAAAIAKAAGADAIGTRAADPRASGAAVAALKAHSDRPVIAVGPFGSEGELADRIDVARTVPELPGGGQLVFPGRRMIALYGSPGTGALGPLGAQDVDATIRRAKRVAAPYEPLSDAPVIPAFEIIVTVASADRGYRGQYTNIIDKDTIRPWIEAARDAGVYVVIDLQPGRMDFLTQAKMFEEFLAEPHVGLALDPEWRIKPNQVHLEQIGTVDPAEVNRTADWLADLVRAKNLPQKVFVLHQFDANMLGDRSKLDFSHPELASVVHADGHGPPGVKMATWERIVAGLPPAVWFGWKNFYKEDTPTFTPRRTMAVHPTPWFISYQ